eukprot:COSAG02_NODE_703_length_18313_cov_58.533652_13_plen_64_part_00
MMEIDHRLYRYMCYAPLEIGDLQSNDWYHSFDCRSPISKGPDLKSRGGGGGGGGGRGVPSTKN